MNTIPAESGFVRDVGADTFQTWVLDAFGAIVVEFMSYGCGHCRVLEPALQSVAEARSGQETYVRVNVAIDRELANRYHITGTPTLVMMRDGDEVGRAVGPVPKATEITKAIVRAFRR